jgi:tellurite resistance protein TehA-like permease
MLFPGCFAFVMATGIVSLAAHLDGLELIATWLLWLNVGAYLALWILTLLCFACFHAQFVGVLTHHSRGAAFLTTTAGTCVPGCQFALLTPWKAVAEVCWLLGATLWVVLGYTFFVAITVCESKQPLEAGISGSWLLIIVATESISVLGSLVAPSMATTEVVLFLSLTTYLVGAMLYVFFATLILYRWMFFRLEPEKLTPDYWIDMGALAISSLAGTLLLQIADRWNLLHRLEPVLTGSALFFWATSTWWIPLLLIMEIWRHLRRVPRTYGPDYWSLVFPLGM